MKFRSACLVALVSVATAQAAASETSDAATSSPPASTEPSVVLTEQALRRHSMNAAGIPALGTQTTRELPASVQRRDLPLCSATDLALIAALTAIEIRTCAKMNGNCSDLRAPDRSPTCAIAKGKL